MTEVWRCGWVGENSLPFVAWCSQTMTAPYWTRTAPCPTVTAPYPTVTAPYQTMTAPYQTNNCSLPDYDCFLPDCDCFLSDYDCSLPDYDCSLPDCDCSLPDCDCSPSFDHAHMVNPGPSYQPICPTYIELAYWQEVMLVVLFLRTILWFLAYSGVVFVDSMTIALTFFLSCVGVDNWTILKKN